MIINLWQYRKFIFDNAVNDLRHRYAGSAMGVFWNVINPLAQILVFTFVFAKIMAARLPGGSSTLDFTIYLCAGFLPWTAFTECILRGSNSLIENANYLKKLPIPEHIFVAKGAVAATLSLLISMLLLFVINVTIGFGIKPSWLAVPAMLILLQAFGFGVGLILSCFNVFFRDIGQMLNIATQMWMWLTPIVYVKDILPPKYQSLMSLNPVFPFIDALQSSIIYGRWPTLWHWGVSVSWALVALAAGYVVLGRLRNEIRDVI